MCITITCMQDAGLNQEGVEKSTSEEISLTLDYHCISVCEYAWTTLSMSVVRMVSNVS